MSTANRVSFRTAGNTILILALISSIFASGYFPEVHATGFSYRDIGHTAETGGTSASSVTDAGSTSTKALILVALTTSSTEPNAGVFSVADTSSLTYTLIADNHGSGKQGMFFFYATSASAISGDKITATPSGLNSGKYGMEVFEVDGAATSSIFDPSTGGFAYGTGNTASVTITTATDHDALLGFFLDASGGSSTYSPGSGFSTIVSITTWSATIGNDYATEYLTTSDSGTHGSQTITATNTNGDTWQIFGIGVVKASSTAYTRSTTDTDASSETVGRVLTAARSDAETSANSESIAARQALARTFTETDASTESIVRALTLARTAAESVVEQYAMAVSGSAVSTGGGTTYFYVPLLPSQVKPVIPDQYNIKIISISGGANVTDITIAENSLGNVVWIRLTVNVNTKVNESLVLYSANQVPLKVINALGGIASDAPNPKSFQSSNAFQFYIYNATYYQASYGSKGEIKSILSNVVFGIKASHHSPVTYTIYFDSSYIPTGFLQTLDQKIIIAVLAGIIVIVILLYEYTKKR